MSDEDVFYDRMFKVLVIALLGALLVNVAAGTLRISAALERAYPAKEEKK